MALSYNPEKLLRPIRLQDSRMLKHGVVWFQRTVCFGLVRYHKWVTSIRLTLVKMLFFHYNKIANGDSFYKSDDSTVWIGTDSGLIRRDEKTGAKDIYT